MIISQVKSGGQTGVDIASLRAAKSLGIHTGGTMPKGFKTLAGPKPEWAREFGLTEHASGAYPPRTYENVRDSDITVRIAVDFESAGERLTLQAITRIGRPWFDVRLHRVGDRCGYGADGAMLIDAIDGLRRLHAGLGRPIVVNFAGNSERTAPGIERFAEGFVRAILEAAR